MKTSDLLLLEFQRTDARVIHCDECDSNVDTRYLDEHLAYHRAQETARERFTRSEAHALIGKTFVSAVEFSCVPQGTRGGVVAADKMGDGYDVVIEWDLEYRRPNGQGLRDWFTKDEFVRFMREVSKCLTC